jgi:hypothetical protein
MKYVAWGALADGQFPTESAAAYADAKENPEIPLPDPSYNVPLPWLSC